MITIRTRPCKLRKLVIGSPKVEICFGGRETLQGRVSRVLRIGLQARWSSLLTLFVFITPLSLVAQTPRKPPTSRPAENEQIYRNATYSFRYERPYGWVDRTKDMHEQRTDNQGPKGEVLLATFERPPEAAGETINSAVVIAAENAADYPGLKKAEDYVGPLIELVTKVGFKQEGDPAYIDVEGRELIRADFSKPLNNKLTMRQSTLVLLTKNRIVSFTFIAATADELDDLVDRLHFTGAKSAH